MVEYSPEVCSEICRRLTEGQSLTSICKRDDMPSTTAVMNWLADTSKSEFLEQYARAREAQADSMAEEIIDIADNEGITPESRRVRIDVRKWYAGKMKPKKYGDKVMHTGNDGESNPVFVLNLGALNKNNDDGN